MIKLELKLIVIIINYYLVFCNKVYRVDTFSHSVKCVYNPKNFKLSKLLRFLNGLLNEYFSTEGEKQYFWISVERVHNYALK